MKKILFFLSLTSLLANSQSLNENLLIHYKFDGNATDFSGNDYHGSVNATLTTDRNGNPNGAYHFDGVSEFISFPNVPQLKPQLPITYSFWAKLDNTNATKTVFVTNCFSINNHSGVWMNGSGSGKLAINYGGASGSTSDDNLRNKIGTTILQTGIWYHFVGICRSATDMELYINCVNDGGSYNGYGGNVNYTNDAGNIGRKDVATQLPYYFKGSMDEFMFWDRALTPDEISMVCNGRTSLDENDFSHVSIYPNPTNAFLNIKNYLDEFNYYRIYSLTGQILTSGTFTEEIDVNYFSAGSYILELFTETKSFKKKFIKD